MASITTRAGKGSPLTHAEVDANFNNLNNGKLDISTAPAGSITVDSSGRVGIGTSSPQDKLAVVGVNGNFTEAAIRVNGSSATTNSDSGLRLYANCSTGTKNWLIAANYSTANTLEITPSTANGGAAYSTPTAVFTSAGLVGIGTTSPGYKLDIFCTQNDGLQIYETSSGNNRRLRITQNAGGVFYDATYSTGLNAHAWGIGGNEVARIDSSGRLLVGTSSARSNYFNTSSIAPSFQIEGTTYSTSSISLIANGNTATANPASYVILGRTRGTSVGSTTVVSSGDMLGGISYQGSDGTEFVEAGSILCEVDGTPGANDMPGRLVFSTTADGASSPTERMRIDSLGTLKVSNNNTYAADNYHQFNQNASSQWTLGVLGQNAVDPYGIRVEYTNAAPNGTVSQFLYCVDTAGVKAEIRSNGGLVNFQANNVNLSDRNAKKDIAPAAGTWDCIKQWEIVNYRYKDQPDDADLNLGVIAQQVAESCPEVITVFEEAKDDQPEKLGVKEQQMYWMAIKALQEAMERIETLEAKVAALEASS